METSCTYIPYESTGYFSKLVIDYLHNKETLQPFYQHPVSIEGIKASVKERQRFPNHRLLLSEELQKQYEGITLTSIQSQNIERLKDENTFTVCTAHQPNIFTGHLYFIYKILHTIKLAQSLNTKLPQYYFVPVFYMGSEDADLEELNHITLDGEKLEWKTKQTGAVGRMKVDNALVALIDKMSDRLNVLQSGKEVTDLLKRCYIVGVTIQQATLKVVNELFKDYGLLVVIPDNARLKKPFNKIVKRELLEEFSHQLVEQTSAEIGRHYKAQASGREINLFYLSDGERERIIKEKEKFRKGDLEWSTDEILKEVDEHPERFSANVILRGVFQETILPNVAFIGGGGEIAYWLQLKNVFEACNVPYPVLIVRNSFMLVNGQQKESMQKLGFSVTDLFKPEQELLNDVVKKNSRVKLKLDEEREQLEKLYLQLQQVAGNVDSTLEPHAFSLYKKADKRIEELEKKMLRAEKKKFQAQQRQISRLRAALFPGGGLQERVDNFSFYYALYGKAWMEAVCDASLTLEQEFAVVELS